VSVQVQGLIAGACTYDPQTAHILCPLRPAEQRSESRLFSFNTMPFLSNDQGFAHFMDRVSRVDDRARAIFDMQHTVDCKYDQALLVVTWLSRFCYVYSSRRLRWSPWRPAGLRAASVVGSAGRARRGG
jgi:hypothetical protein